MRDILYKYITDELQRQRDNIELIASENFVSEDILNITGSVLTNKYAEGYSTKRYYGGCENVDKIEDLACEKLKELFDAKYVNVQAHSGSSANMAIYKALLNPKDKVLGMNLSDGGHLTHGHSMSFSGKEYEIVSYGVDSKTEIIDYDSVREIALREKPKMIIAGASAYSRKIDFKKFREIADEVGAYFMVDMAHIAGLVAANLHENPIYYADVVTSTTHKTLRGPRGGIILTNNEEIYNKINKVVFPGLQGGPLMHVIAAKAMCFIEALTPEFKKYQENVVKNASVFADEFIKLGYHVVSGGTDNHLFLLDVKTKAGLTGKEAEAILEKINITVNKNTIPNDSEKPFVTSGIRIGTAAMTTRGLLEEDFIEIANIINEALLSNDNEIILEKLKIRVKNITEKYPLYKNL
ncbi:MAG: serine hydroxymethyltransferase [Bacilli bacterium]|nr:serine hydroxymethyltransferase [Bacilli bacterium]